MEAEINTFLRRRKYSDRTRDSYRYMLRKLFETYPTLDTLTPDQLSLFVEQKQWANSTQYLAYCAARAFLIWRYGQKFPALEYKFYRTEPAPQRTLTAEELDTLFKSFPPGDLGRRNLAIVSLAVDTGLRASELCRVTLDHLHLSETTNYLQVIAKGGKWQTKGFSLITALDIDNWLSVRDFYALDGVDTVFVSLGGNKPGNAMTRDGLRAIVSEWANRAGLKHFSPHAFRRTGATLASLNGASDDMLMKQFGWKHAEQVRRYLQALTADTFPQLYSPVSSIRK